MKSSTKKPRVIVEIRAGVVIAAYSDLPDLLIDVLNRDDQEITEPSDQLGKHLAALDEEIKTLPAVY